MGYRKAVYALLAAAMVMSMNGCAEKEETTESVPAEETASAEPEKTPEPTAEPTPTAEATPEPDPVEELLANMTLREKVGQLFVIRPDALDLSLDQDTINDSEVTGVTAVSAEMLQTLTDYPVGGYCIFGKNLEDPEQLAALQEGLKTGTSIAPLFSIDEEGGMVARLANQGNFDVEQFPNMQTMAENGDTDAVYAMGETIGTYLNRYGFTLDFAPDADVNTNPDNPVIGVRAFGSDPAAAAQMVSACVQGMHAGGVGTTLKHFPGHGDTSTDSHQGYAITYKNWDEIRECEMLPFEAGIEAGTDAVMVAHITAPEVTGDNTPSTLSYTIVTEKLRNELGFDGLVVTDSLAMGAITQYYTPGESAVLALQAGCDILLMPNGLTSAFDAVVQAVENGEVSEERLNESVERILRFKEKYGLLG